MQTRRDLILEVIYAPLTGGSETLAFALCKQWKQEGVATRICCLYERAGELTSLFEAAGIPYDLLDLGPRSFLVRYLILARYFARWRPRAIHVHHLGMLINIIVPAYFTGCRRVVYTEHSARTIARTRWMRGAAPLVARMVSKVTCVSNKLGRFFRELKVPSGKLVTVYNGVDTDAFKPRDESTSRKERLRIGAVGRLVDEKDYPTLLEAVALLNSGTLAFEVCIVGDGPLGTDLVAQAASLGISQVVQFYGQRNDIPQLLRSFDIYVLSSKSEGLPIAILEAMATGLAIIATEVDAVPEVITHEENGLIVPIGSAAVLAAGLARLLLDKDLRTRLGRKALADARLHYSIEQATRRYAGYLGLNQYPEYR